jgi:hypothetical protein
MITCLIAILPIAPPERRRSSLPLLILRSAKGATQSSRAVWPRVRIATAIDSISAKKRLLLTPKFSLRARKRASPNQTWGKCIRETDYSFSKTVATSIALVCGNMSSGQTRPRT